MEQKKERFLVVKKYDELNRLLDQDFRDIFRNLVLAAGELIKLKNIPKGLLYAWDAVKDTISKKGDPIGHRAYRLIYYSLRRALLEITHDSKEILLEAFHEEGGKLKYDATRFEELAGNLDFAFTKEEFSLPERFLEHPEELPVVAEIQKIFVNWWVEIGISKTNAGHLGRRVKLYFVRMLDTLMREDPEYFGSIHKELASQFPSKRTWGRLQYENSLVDAMEEPIFGEPFGLDQVFIPLRACYEVKEKQQRGAHQETERKHHVVDALEHIWDWLVKDKWEAPIMVLKGGPGAGKSSLMKEIAKRLVLDPTVDSPVYFIHLHHFQYSEAIQDGIQRFIEYNEYLDEHTNPFDKHAIGSARKPIFIFDGLDELSRSGGTGKAIAGDFVEKLLSLLTLLNERKGWQVKALLTGRDYIIQQTTSVPNSKPKQTLELLPYFIDQERSEWISYNFIDPLALLSVDQRKAWWGKFWKAKGHEKQVMPKILAKKSEYRSLSIQPLLSYLLAKASVDGIIQENKIQNINTVYEGLIDDVRDRKWGNHKHTHIDSDKYFRVYEEAATAAWHGGDVRSTTLKAIRTRCKEEDIEDLVEEFMRDKDDQYKRLVVAFFMRGKGLVGDGEQLVEFTHKSFGEYLVARKIVRELTRLLEGWKHKMFKMKFVADSWMNLFGVNALTEFIWDFLIKEISLRIKEKEKAAEYQLQLSKLYNFFVGEGVNIPTKTVTNRDVVRMTRNAEESLLLIISACARVSKKLTTVGWPPPPPSLLVGIMTEEKPLLRRAFHRFHFPEKSDLSRLNLSWANLSWASVKGAKLERANFNRANLKGINLNGSDLQKAHMNVAILEQAELKGANLSEVSFVGAILIDADLSKADLTLANLRRADLGRANLESVNMPEANLMEANLVGTNLLNANLVGANLLNANLVETNLSKVNLSWTELTGTKLALSSNFTDAIISKKLFLFGYFENKKVTGDKLYEILTQLGATIID